MPFSDESRRGCGAQEHQRAFWKVRRQIKKYLDADPEVLCMHKGFLVDVIQSDPSEAAFISRYQVPHGTFNTQFLHILHWHPESKHSKGYTSLVHDDKNLTIKYLLETFPYFKDDLSCDIYCKQESLTDSNGRRKTQARLYGYKKTLHLHYIYTAKLVCRWMRAQKGSGTPCIVLWGRPVRDWHFKHFGAGSTVKVLDNKCDIYWLDHPEHLRRFATSERIQRNIDVMGRIKERHGMSIDFKSIKQLLQRRLVREKATVSKNTVTGGDKSNFQDYGTKVEDDDHLAEDKEYRPKSEILRLQQISKTAEKEQSEDLKKHMQIQQRIAIEKTSNLRNGIIILESNPLNSVDTDPRGTKRSYTAVGDEEMIAKQKDRAPKRAKPNGTLDRLPQGISSLAKFSQIQQRAFRENYKYVIRFVRLQLEDGLSSSKDLHIGMGILIRDPDSFRSIFSASIHFADSITLSQVRLWCLEERSDILGVKFLERHIQQIKTMFAIKADLLRATVGLESKAVLIHQDFLRFREEFLETSQFLLRDSLEEGIEYNKLGGIEHIPSEFIAPTPCKIFNIVFEILPPISHRQEKRVEEPTNSVKEVASSKPTTNKSIFGRKDAQLLSNPGTIYNVNSLEVLRTQQKLKEVLSILYDLPNGGSVIVRRDGRLIRETFKKCGTQSSRSSKQNAVSQAMAITPTINFQSSSEASNGKKFLSNVSIRQ